MCGLTGFWRPGGFEGPRAEADLAAMTDALRHRGPDDRGLWLDPAAGIALGHRRLAIVDLSPAGHQPMPSASGRRVLAFNGEIYNHLALRDALAREGAAPAWRGRSDTETLLACIEAWGLERALREAAGMFAFALWDRAARRLFLARDRLGEKPLYYGWHGDTLLFGSELKALTAHPGFRREVDRGAVALLLRHHCIPAPHSIWRGIAKLAPGAWIAPSPAERDAAPQPYWSLREVAEAGQHAPFDGGPEAASRALETVLGDAVEAQMAADVPLGALLSGGIDSSSIVALMQQRATRPVRTFSIGFDARDHDESAHAAAVARHLRTEHTELRMRAADVLDWVPRMPTIYDEPFADSSQLPTALVMALARRHVTVALSGDGGDELFAGYNRHALAPRLWRLLGPLPAPLRRALGAGLLAVPPARWDRLAAPLARAVHQVHPGDKLHKLGRRLRQACSVDDLYVALRTEWEDAADVAGAAPPPTLLERREDWPRLVDPVSRMMALDALTYLPDDILAKVDRSAMAASLETRAPFLDPAVVAFAWRLPPRLRFAGGQGKAVLRRMLRRHVPATLIDRPKMGFRVPLDAWLRGELRAWAADLLAPEALRAAGLIDPAPVDALWRRHLSGACDAASRLWPVLMLQAWCRQERIGR
ncbi:asparagine synthase (glutamine-hydrolyzing) [Luteimonas sp. Y-2-2-4F]|nr:asparagine synthase (glutamine-hydrolyzing) [Luteimonas sp. Y-2-2-4F]MCD9032755.1 asparagine synthase (glutamine-hydrolyzing) [Luteimonas sp. Y-2-2-4F]